MSTSLVVVVVVIVVVVVVIVVVVFGFEESALLMALGRLLPARALRGDKGGDCPAAAAAEPRPRRRLPRGRAEWGPALTTARGVSERRPSLEKFDTGVVGGGEAGLVSVSATPLPGVPWRSAGARGPPASG